VNEVACMEEGKMEYVVIKAKEDGVEVMGLKRGPVTSVQHLEKLDQGEVMIAQFTEHTSAIKVRGNAQVFTPYGEVESTRK